jgi:hypothetical protein
MYYGTGPTDTSRGYHSIAEAVTAAAGSATTISAWQLALFGALPQNGLILIAGGGGVFVVGLDTTVASVTTEDSVVDWDAAVNDDAQIEFSWHTASYVNGFNAAGLILDRTAFGPDAASYTVTYASGDSMDVTSDGATATILFSVVHQMSIASDLDGLRLVGDQASPGASYVYSTDESGAKGWHVTDGVWLDMVSGTMSHIGPHTTGGTTITWPSSLTWDAKGHVYAAVGGVAPVTSLSTLVGTGGPLTGAVTLEGAGDVTLSVSGQTIIITGSGSSGPYGPAPTSGPVLTAAPGNAQIAWSWTTITGATQYTLTVNGSQIYSGSGTGITQTGLTNGTLYSGSVQAIVNQILSPAGLASARPSVPGKVWDQCTGANGSPFQGRTPDTSDYLSGTWTKDVSYFSGTAPSGLQVQSNTAQELTFPGVNDVSYSMITIPCGAADGTFTFNFVLGSDLNYAQCAFVARYSGAGSYIELLASRDGTAPPGYDLAINVWSGGSPTQIATVGSGSTFAIGTVYTASVTLSGSSVSMTVGGQTVSGTSTHNQTTQTHGAAVIHTGVSAVTHGYVTDWQQH